MLLALDVGNTHVVVGLMEGREVRRSFRIATRRDNAVGDYAVALSQLLELAEGALFLRECLRTLYYAGADGAAMAAVAG